MLVDDLHAQRSLTPRRSRSIASARRRLTDLTRPTSSPGYLFQRPHLEHRISDDRLQPPRAAIARSHACYRAVRSLQDGDGLRRDQLSPSQPSRARGDGARSAAQRRDRPFCRARSSIGQRDRRARVSWRTAGLCPAAVVAAGTFAPPPHPARASANTPMSTSEEQREWFGTPTTRSAQFSGADIARPA